MKTGPALLLALMLPERRQFALYSRLPAMAILGPQMLTRRDLTERFSRFRNAAGEIDVVQLAALLLSSQAMTRAVSTTPSAMPTRSPITARSIRTAPR